MTRPLWFYVSSARQYPYCVLRSAVPGGRVTALCSEGDGYSASLPYGALLVTTEHPGDLACRQCDRHLGVTMRGAAVAVGDLDDDYEELAIKREAGEERR